MAGPFTNKDGEEYARDIVWNGYDANLQPEVVEVLNRAQQLVDFPITLNSGYRSPARNARAGGAKKSQHMLGNAVDVSVKGLTNDQRTQLTRALAQSGARRLGAYSGNTALHLDMAAGYKPQKGYSVYAMFDRTRHRMDSAPSWYKAGLDGGKIPPRNIPSVASALDSFAAPVPASLSSYVSTQRNPPPLPRPRPTAPTLVPNVPGWMEDYSRVIGQHQPQRPAGQASLTPPQATNWQDDYRRVISQHQGLPPGTAPSTRGPGYKSIDPKFASTTGGVGGRAGAGAGYRASGSLSLPPLPPRPASAEARVTARNRAALAPPAAPARLPNLPISIPRTPAEEMWATTNFGSPRDLPGLDMGTFADLQTLMAPDLPPLPRPRPAFMQPQFQPVTVRGGNRMAPVPMPRLNRNVATPVAASNGYVYAVNPHGGAPVRVGTTRPAGMTAAQDYDRRAAAARASSPDNGGNPSWW